MSYEENKDALRGVKNVLKDTRFAQELDAQDMTERLTSLGCYYDDLNGQNEALRRVIQENVILKSKYKRLYEEAPAGYVVFTADGQISEANKTFCRMMAISPEEVPDHTITDFFPPLQQELLQQTFQDILQNGTQASLELTPIVSAEPSDVLMLIDRFWQGIWTGQSFADSGS